MTAFEQPILDSLKTADVTDPSLVFQALLTTHFLSDIQYTLQFKRFTRFPCYSEIKYVGKGDCYNLACLYTYSLRAAGIPATIDIVPVWGSENGGHSEAVFLHKSGKYQPYDVNRFNRAARVYHYFPIPLPIVIDTTGLDRSIIKHSSSTPRKHPPASIAVCIGIYYL